MVFVVLCPGAPQGSTESGSGFKASQKTGPRLKVSSDRLGEALVNKALAYPLHHCGFSKNHHVIRYKFESLVLFLLLSVKH